MKKLDPGFPEQAKDVLVISAWMGIIAGVGEGFLFLMLQWSGRLVYVNEQIIWISTIFNLGLFTVIAVPILTLGLLFRKIQLRLFSVFIFSFLVFLNWVGLIFFERVYLWALVIFASGAAVAVLRSFRSKPCEWMKFWHKSLPYCLGLTGLLVILLQGVIWMRERIAYSDLPISRPGAPNVLLIVIDTLRSDHISSNGYSRKTTPFLDQIAERGISFEHAFSTSSYSLTSHVSLLTGKDNYEHGVEWDKPKALKSSPFPTLAEVMKENGYRTGGFSANLFWTTQEQGFNRGFLHFEDYFQTIGEFFVRPFYGRVLSRFYHKLFEYNDFIGRRNAADVNQAVLNWVKQDSEKPFFIFVNYIDTHDPYLPPQPYRSKFSELQDPGGIINNDLGRKDPQLTPEQFQGEIDAYDGAINYVDDQIGNLVDQMEQQTEGNLLLIVTSDHGEAFNEHGTYLHGRSLYREEIQVPLLIDLPNPILQRLRISQPVSLTSIPATILAVAGIESKQDFTGQSLMALVAVRNGTQPWALPLAEIAQRDWEPEQSPVYSGWIKTLINPKWQYIEYQKRAPELFELNADPQQMKNLADIGEMKTILESFQEQLSGLITRANHK